MASISNLPSELLARIVDLSVEDKLTYEKDKIRREILLNLSLVMKSFTEPAQKALWRKIGTEQLKFSPFMKLIEQGFAQNMVVEVLTFETSGYQGPSSESLVRCLEGVARVKTLDLIDYYESESGFVPLPILFTIPSLQNLTSLKLHSIQLNISEVALPSTLSKLTFSPFGKISEPFFNLLKLSQSNIIEYTMPERLPLINYQLDLHMLEYFKVSGAALTKFTLICSLPAASAFQLLAFTPSLVTLIFHGHRPIDEIMQCISALPSTTRLKSLDIAHFRLEDCITKGFLLPLINLPHLSELKVLRHTTAPTAHGFFYETGVDTGERYFWETRSEESLRKIRIGAQKGLDKSWKLCRSRGIRLCFLKEAEEIKFKQNEAEKRWEVEQQRFEEFGN